MSTRTPLSFYVLTKNSEQYLDEILSRVEPVVDEIVVVDSGSMDNTEKIVSKYSKAKFLYRSFDNFKNQRNYAADACLYDYVFFLDSDEIPSFELIECLQKVKENGFEVYAYQVKRKWEALGKDVHAIYPVQSPDTPFRLINKQFVRFAENSNRVHETPSGFDSCATLDGYLIHKTFQTKQELKRKLEHYTDIAALDLINSGKTINWLKQTISPIGAFIKWYILMDGYKDGRVGLIFGRYAYSYTKEKYRKARKEIKKM